MTANIGQVCHVFLSDGTERAAVVVRMSGSLRDLLVYPEHVVTEVGEALLDGQAGLRGPSIEAHEVQIGDTPGTWHSALDDIKCAYTIPTIDPTDLTGDVPIVAYEESEPEPETAPVDEPVTEAEPAPDVESPTEPEPVADVPVEPTTKTDVKFAPSTDLTTAMNQETPSVDPSGDKTAAT